MAPGTPKMTARSPKTILDTAPVSQFIALVDDNHMVHGRGYY